MTSRLEKYLKNPYYAVGNYLFKRYPNLMPDEWFLKVMWKKCMGYKLDLKHPQTFNEKLQWLKLYDRNPLYIVLVDKYRVKQWVAEKIGEQYVIPTLAVYNSVDEIDLDALPDKFVLKCNHDSGSTIICNDKSTFDLDAAKKKLAVSLKKNYFFDSREWPYKRVKRCIIAEKYMEDLSVDDVIDYKIMSFNGVVKCSFTCTNRWNKGGLNVTFFDKDWNRLPFTRNYPVDKNPIEKPKSYELMVKLTQRLTEQLPFSRVDFYEIDGAPYFGEITLYPGSGFEPFDDKEWDYILGEWIELPKKQR